MSAAQDSPEWSVQARLLRAGLGGDEREWRHLLELNRQAGSRFGVMPAAFVLVLHRRFGGVQDLREVGWFVSRYNAIAPAEHRVPPREAEAVLRGSLGEPHLADLVNEKTTVRVMYSLLFTLVDELALTEDELDSLVTEADHLTACVVGDALDVTPEDPIELSEISGETMPWRPPRVRSDRTDGSRERKVPDDHGPA